MYVSYTAISIHRFASTFLACNDPPLAWPPSKQSKHVSLIIIYYQNKRRSKPKEQDTSVGDIGLA
jgi:hypothetical protein